MLPIYDRFVSRLNVAGLLPLCTLVQVTAPEEGQDLAKCFTYDRSLLAALVDRWRPETYTFYLPVGEVVPTLEDISFLLDLPCAGAAVTGPDVSSTWHEELEHRFAGTIRRVGAPIYRPTLPIEHYGPTKKLVAAVHSRAPGRHHRVKALGGVPALVVRMDDVCQFAQQHGGESS